MSSPGQEDCLQILKRDILSIKDCNSATVDAVSALLAQKGTAVSIKRQQTTTIRNGAKGKRVALKEIQQPKAPSISTESPALSESDKVKFATEIVNAALKSLTQVIRTQASPIKSRQTSAKSITNRPNENTSSMGNVRSVASCAIAAFALLRSPSIARKDHREYTIEAGVSALIGKLIALDEDDMALQELCALVDILTSANTSTAKSHQACKSAHLPQLLLPRDYRNDKHGVALAFACQLHCLRLVSKSGFDVAILAFNNLQKTEISGPLQLISLCVGDQSLDHGEANKTFQSLVQCIIVIANKLQSQHANEPPGLKERCLELSLRYQILGLQMQTRANCVLQNSGYDNGNILDSLIEYVRAFSRQSIQSDHKFFSELAKDVQKILEVCKSPSDLLQISRIEASLANLASRCIGQDQVDNLWRQAANSAQKVTASEPGKLGLIIDICLEGLQARVTPKLLEELLFDLATSLRSITPRDHAQLETLLISVSSLRRQLVERYRLDLAESGQALTSATPFRNLDIYFLALPAIAEFVLQCLQKCEVGLGSHEGHQCRQLASMVNRIARQTIDSVLMLPRAAMSTASSHCDTILTGLGNCAQILNILNAATTQGLLESLDGRLTGIHVKISDQLFALSSSSYFQERSTVSKIALLKASVNVLASASPDTKRHGRYGEKLVKLVKVCENVGSSEDTDQALVRLAQHCEAIGALTGAVAGAKDLNVNDQVEDEESTALLNLTAKAFVQVPRGKGPGLLSRLFVEAVGELDACAKGFLAECQLSASSEVLHSRAQVCKDINAAAVEALSSCYLADQHPVRRLRIITSILQIAQFWPQLSDPTLLSACREELCGFDPQCLAHDGDIAAEVPLLSASAQISLAYSESGEGGGVKMDLVRSALSTWAMLSKNDLLGWSAEKTRSPLIWNQMMALADYLQANEAFVEYLSALQALSMLCRHNCFGNPSERLFITVRLARAHLAAGNRHEAEKIIKASQLSECHHISDKAIVAQFEALQASLALAMGKSQSASVHLESASHYLLGSPRSKQASDGPQALRGLTVATVLCTYSDKHEMAGMVADALIFARAGAKSATSAWRAALKRSQLVKPTGCRAASPDIAEDDESKDQATRGRDVPSDVVMSSPSLLASANQLIDSLVTLSKRLADSGLVVEGRQHLRQAERIAEMLKLSRRCQRLLLLSASFSIVESKVEDAIQSLRKIVTANEERDMLRVEAEIELCRAYYIQGDLGEAKSLLEHLHLVPKETRASNHASQTKTLDSLEQDLKQLKITKSRTAKGRSKSRSAKRDFEATQNMEATVASPPVAPARLQVRVSLLRISLSTDDSVVADLLASLENSDLSCSTVEEQLLKILVQYNLHLKDALDYIALDPVFNSLADAPLSYPAKLEKPNAETMLSRPLKPSGRQKRPTARSRTKYPSAEPGTAAIHVPTKSVAAFHAALECLTKISELARNGASTYLVHDLAYKLVKVSMYISATDGTLSNELPYLLSAGLELGRSSAWSRQLSAIAAESMLSGQDELGLLAPTFKGPSMIKSAIQMESSFQSTFIDVLPQSWTVISLSLSNNRDEIQMSRLRRSSPPFVVTLPLGRNLDGSEEDECSFELARAELREIVEMANFSAHDSSNISKKGAKTEWWKIRKALDERLKELLDSMDKTWLGGFSGLFGTPIGDSKAFVTFKQRFERILDTNLPSRSRHARSPKMNTIQLETQVVELFVGLRRPAVEGDLDEPLLDLLAFVIDILQFNGERNAFDEVDFDAMVLEVLDALNEYHHLASRQSTDAQDAHTILILDKHLHCFPWESLPCMQGLSVSRLPSLEMLRTRLEEQRQSPSWTTEIDIMSCDVGNGGCILNPAGDLHHTEDTFSTPLSSLPSGWSKIIRRAPKEDEIAELLRDRSLYIYLGHGSGGQYIRSRTVKKLGKCAVSLLLGCSSATVTEAGQYESYGTPLTYLQGGAPAVVGTLWDVTDKDIDRFSMKMLQRWGLFGDEASVSNDGESGINSNEVVRGKKGGRSQASHQEAPVALDTALSDARGECLLRYLNGAAPVVYGVPVVLQR